jgi:hypothetical protein
MKKLLLLFAFINSYWTFGQLTYTFDAEYYSCGNYYSQYCQPNTNIISTGYSEPYNVFSWNFGYYGDDYHRGSRSFPKKITSTIGVENEFILTTNYDYDNSFYTLDAKPPGRTVYEPSCGYCDYKKDYSNDPSNPGGGRYYSESRGRIFFQGRYINWNYDAYREPQNTSGTADTQDFLSVKIPMTRMAGSNCDDDYCVECSVVTGGIAYDSADDVPDGQIILSNFHPNDLVITRMDNASTNILAGVQIHLQASTPGVTTTQFFPDFVYNWQYSTDGGAYWEDVPDKLVNGKKINKKREVKFSMQEMLNDGHTSVFGPIAFRLGYGTGNRAFTNILHFNYKAGAPVVTGVEYVAPKCSGDPVTSLDVYFDRKLEAGESIWPLQIVSYPKISQDQPKLSQEEVTNLVYDPIKEKYKHSFIITTVNNKLINNTTYAVEYQGMVNGVGKGYLLSEQPFVYQNPEPITFTIDPTDPLCHNGEGGLTINVKGGSGKYSYSLDEGSKIPFTVTTVETSSTTNNITTISRSASQPLNLSVSDAKKSYKIKVTDEHDCIEKSL